MTVKSLFPKEIGGVERHNNYLTRHLVSESDKNLEIDIIHPYSEEIFSDLDKVKEHLLNSKNESVIDRFAYSRKETKKIDFLKKEKDFDLFYSVRSSILYSMIFSYSLPAPLIYHNHGYHQLQEGDFEELTKNNLIKTKMVKTGKTLPTRLIAQQADYVASLGGRLNDLLQKKLDISSEKIIQIPNAVDLEYIDDFEKNGEKIPNSILFVGHIELRKGIWNLLESLEILRSKNRIPKTFIIGSGRLEDDSKFISKINKLGDRVRFLGHVSEEELYEWYSRVDGFVFPTLVDGMPTVILEAMAKTTPVIATDVGAIPLLVEEGKNGFIVPPSDSRALAEKIQKFLTLSDREKKNLGRYSRKRAERFSWPRTAKRILRSFNRISAENIHAN